MTPFKNYFIEYTEFDGGRVMMRNNTICKVIGISNVSLRLHDGTMFEMKQARPIPKLKDLIRNV